MINYSFNELVTTGNTKFSLFLYIIHKDKVI